MHRGIDVALPAGTKIQSVMDGVVTRNGFQKNGAGYWIEVQHPDGRRTRYMHLLEQSPIAVGTRVSRGTVIGKVGSTGRSTGPHLHFELIDATGAHVDPRAWLNRATPAERRRAQARQAQARQQK